MSDIDPTSYQRIPTDDDESGWGELMLTALWTKGTALVAGVGALRGLITAVQRFFVDPTDFGNPNAEIKFQEKYTVDETGIPIVNESTKKYKSISGSVIDNGNEIIVVAGNYNVVLDPTGFRYPIDVIPSHDSTARTITLTGVTEAYFQNILVEPLIPGWESLAYPENPTATQFLYFIGNAFVWSETPWEFYDLQIAAVVFSKSGELLFALKETHGLNLPYSAHQSDHENIGTHKVSGSDITGIVYDSTVPSERRPAVSETLLHDEDNHTILPALAAGGVYSGLSLTSTDTVTIDDSLLDIVPVSGSNPYYNRFDGANFIQTLMPDSRFMCVWKLDIPVTLDAFSQKRRYTYVQGQNIYTTQQACELEQVSNINLGELTQLSPEGVFTKKFIIQHINGVWSVSNIIDIEGGRVQQLDGSSNASLEDSAVSITSPATSSPSGLAVTQNVSNEEFTNNFVIVYDTLAQLAGATGSIMGDPLPQAIAGTETIATWIEVKPSTNTDIFVFNDTLNEVLIKEPGIYQWITSLTISNSSTQTRVFSFATIDKNNPGTRFYERSLTISRDGYAGTSTIQFEIIDPNTTIEVLAWAESLGGAPVTDLAFQSWNTDLNLNSITNPVAYLPIGGGVMEGDINMGENDIAEIGSLYGYDELVSTLYNFKGAYFEVFCNIDNGSWATNINPSETNHNIGDTDGEYSYNYYPFDGTNVATWQADFGGGLEELMSLSQSGLNVNDGLSTGGKAKIISSPISFTTAASSTYNRAHGVSDFNDIVSVVVGIYHSGLARYIYPFDDTSATTKYTIQLSSTLIRIEGLSTSLQSQQCNILVTYRS
jgi:hypothetical protein